MEEEGKMLKKMLEGRKEKNVERGGRKKIVSSLADHHRENSKKKMPYPNGKGLCIVFLQDSTNNSFKKDIERIREMCLQLKVDFQEEFNLTKSELQSVHEKIKASLPVYKLVIKIILARGGLDGWNEDCFFTYKDEYVNLRRDFLVHYAVDKLTSFYDRPDVTIVQLHPPDIQILNTWDNKYIPSSIFNNVDKAMWCCLSSKEEKEIKSISFVQDICDTLIAYPDCLLTQLVYAVNYSRYKRDLCGAKFITTLRWPVLICADEVLTRKRKNV
jgi:hypothetical protein